MIFGAVHSECQYTYVHAFISFELDGLRQNNTILGIQNCTNFLRLNAYPAYFTDYNMVYKCPTQLFKECFFLQTLCERLRRLFQSRTELQDRLRFPVKQPAAALPK